MPPRLAEENAVCQKSSASANRLSVSRQTSCLVGPETMFYLKFIQGEAERVELAQSTEGKEKGRGDLPAASSSLKEQS